MYLCYVYYAKNTIDAKDNLRQSDFAIFVLSRHDGENIFIRCDVYHLMQYIKNVFMFSLLISREWRKDCDINGD